FGFAENTDDLFVGKTLLHGDVLMWLMKTLLTSGCTNQRGAGQINLTCDFYIYRVPISRSCNIACIGFKERRSIFKGLHNVPAFVFI
ncbi:hypothetical protein, partial [Enterobacter asburiae]|uniref:hypothetical protein n=1 Tax=Enterobacter asburiae TaxID=61645 RepID=UPI001E50CFAC